MGVLKNTINNIRDIKQVDAANKSVGRALFRNSNGFINNVAGRSNIAKARLLSDYEPTNNEQANQLRSQGFVELGKIVDDETISSIQDQYIELLESGQSYPLREHDGEVYSRSVSRIYQQIPELGHLLTDEVKEIVQDYYKSHLGIKHLHAWRNYHAPRELLKDTEIYSDSWHCDVILTDVVKLFVNLSDVTEEHGPFHVISRDASRDLINQGYERNREEMPDRFVDEDEVTKAIGPTGSAMLCTTWNCFHRAGHIAEGNTRDIIQFQFEPSTELLPEDPEECLDTVKPLPREK